MVLPNYKVLVPHRPFHTEPQMTAFVQEVLLMETMLLINPLDLELSLVYLTVIQMLHDAPDRSLLWHLLRLHCALAEIVVATDWLPSATKRNYQQVAARYQKLMDMLTSPQKPTQES